MYVHQFRHYILATVHRRSLDSIQLLLIICFTFKNICNTQNRNRSFVIIFKYSMSTYVYMCYITQLLQRGSYTNTVQLHIVIFMQLSLSLKHELKLKSVQMNWLYCSVSLLLYMSNGFVATYIALDVLICNEIGNGLQSGCVDRI